MTLPGRIPAVGRVPTVGRWPGYDSDFNPESLADLWSINPANSTLGGTLAASGTTPPVVTLTGTLTVPKGVRVEITGAGVLGAAVFRVSLDNGSSFIASNVTTVATYTIPTTSIVLNFPAGTYAADNVYRATIASIHDTSPAAQDCSQATATVQPFFTLAHSSFNGNPTIDAPNGTGTCLDTGLFTPIGGTTTHVVVCKSTSANTGASQGFFTRTPAGSNLRAATMNTVTGVNVRFVMIAGSNTAFFGNVFGPSILIVEFTTTTVSLWLNGLSLGRLSSTVDTQNSFRLLNNAANPGTAPFTGSIADVRYVGKALSRTERRAFFKYFSDKHAIPIVLAA